MTDLELTRLCAEAMGIKTRLVSLNGHDTLYWITGEGLTENFGPYIPIHDDAQAMALLFLLITDGVVAVTAFGFSFRHDLLREGEPFIYHKMESLAVLRRAIVECVAKMAGAVT